MWLGEGRGGVSVVVADIYAWIFGPMSRAVDRKHKTPKRYRGSRISARSLI